MTDQPTTEELALFDEISHLGKALWARSLEARGLNTDPKMYSVMLYKRLWSNHRGYAVLHNAGLSLEGDIILRSGLEAAICIAANFYLRDEFVVLMRADAAFTLNGQIKLHRAAGSMDLVREAEASLRLLLRGLPEGRKAAKLDWAELAEHGQVPLLYGFHRMLSGVSSHVTGVSILRGTVDGDSQDFRDELTALSRKNHLMMMAAATLQGSMLHAGMIGDDTLLQASLSILERLNAVSMQWDEGR